MYSSAQHYLQLMTNPHAYAGYLEIVAAQFIYNITISVTIYTQHDQLYPATPNHNTCNIMYLPSSSHYVSLRYNAWISDKPPVEPNSRWTPLLLHRPVFNWVSGWLTPSARYPSKWSAFTYVWPNRAADLTSFLRLRLRRNNLSACTLSFRWRSDLGKGSRVLPDDVWSGSCPFAFVLCVRRSAFTALPFAVLLFHVVSGRVRCGLGSLCVCALALLTSIWV